MDKINVGFVGCGLMGQLVHLPILADLEQCDLVALAEVRPQLGQRVARKFNIPKVYRSHEELAADSEVQAVVAITTDDLHASIAKDLLEAGKDVLIEKPLTTNVADGEQMVLTAERSGAILMVSFMRRFDPGVELAKQCIDELRASGEIGEITFVHSHRFGNDWFCNIGVPIETEEAYPEVPKTAPSWLPPDTIDRFRAFNSAYCHNVDLLRHLLGEVERVEFANIGPSGKIVVLGFSGTSATIEAGSNPAPFWDEEIKVFFSKGSVHIRLPPPLLRNVAAQVEVFKATGTREVQRPQPPWEWSFRNVHRHFLECVTNRREPRTSGRVSLETLRVTEAILAKHLEQDGGN